MGMSCLLVGSLQAHVFLLAHPQTTRRTNNRSFSTGAKHDRTWALPAVTRRAFSFQEGRSHLEGGLHHGGRCLRKGGRRAAVTAMAGPLPVGEGGDLVETAVQAAGGPEKVLGGLISGVKKLASPLAGELAMAAVGFIASLALTGSWRSIPGLRGVAQKVQVNDPAFCVPPYYFPRPQEEAYLEALLVSQPQGILLITGPPSSGKTALVSRVLQKRTICKVSVKGARPASEQCSPGGGAERQVAGDPVYINMRFGDFLGSVKLGCELSRQFRQTVESLATAKSEEVKKVLGQEDTAQVGAGILRVLRGLPKAKEAIPPEVEKWLSALEKMGLECNLESSIAQIQTILKRLVPGWTSDNPPPSPKDERILPPVFVIDAAEELMKWEDAVSLDILLRFLVGTTRERGQAHVVLVSSDSRFLKWLQNHIGGDTFVTEVIGDLSEADARDFYNKVLLPLVESDPLRRELEQRWGEVFELCGGRAYLLRKAVTRAIAGSNVSAALQDELVAAGRRVLRGLVPETLPLRKENKPPGWSADDFMQVLRALDRTKDGHVLYGALATSVGAAKVEAMIEYGLLEFRPWSRAAGGDTRGLGGDCVGVRYPSDLRAVRQVLQGCQQSDSSQGNGLQPLELIESR